MEEIMKQAAKHPFLDGFSPANLQRIAECAMPVELRQGEWVFHEGEPANRFYLIHSGRIELVTEEDGEQMLIEELGAGDVLGWSWLFPPFYWHFGARVVDSAKATFFYGTRLREISEEDPEFGYDLMQRVVQVLLNRLHVTRQKLVKLSQLKRGH